MLQAKMERGNILLKLGKVDEAIQDYESLVCSNIYYNDRYMITLQAADGHKEGQEQLEVVSPLPTQIEEARYLVENGKYEDGIHFLTQIIEVTAHMMSHDHVPLGIMIAVSLVC